MKYFNQETGKLGVKYTGDRFIEDLEAVVKDKLLTGCDVADTSSCSEKEAAYVEKMKTKAKVDNVKDCANNVEGGRGW